MVAAKPVTVQHGAFIFCRTSLAALLWVAFLARLPGLVVVAAAILAASAALGVGRAPLILLYTRTAGRVWPGGFDVLDERAMRFAHALGMLMTAAAAALILYRPGPGYVWLFIVAVAKTAGACGFCSGVKLYGCVTNDECCAWIGKRA